MEKDKYSLYLGSVQTPKEDAQFVARRFRSMTGMPLRILREDFCGTANLICEHVRMHSQNIGIGIDSDLTPLRWCKKNNFKTMSEEQQKRVLLMHKNVLHANTPPADLVVAFNYSYCVFYTREKLLKYFQAVRKALRPGGIFMLDVHGGSAVPIEDQEVWDLKSFQYVWDVTSFDPITNRIVCKIHFQFPDGSRMKDAFVYDWRLWSIPELLELLTEARFKNLHVLWEGTDSKTGLGDGILRRVEKGRAEGAWYAILVGTKR